jgi:hypothetical protein
VNLYLFVLEALALIGVPAILAVCVLLILADVREEEAKQKRVSSMRVTALDLQLGPEFERHYAEVRALPVLTKEWPERNPEFASLVSLPEFTVRKRPQRWGPASSPRRLEVRRSAKEWRQ